MRSPAEGTKTAGSRTEDADLAHLLRATSRTFALSIELLDGGIREEIRVAYLILRVSDYLEDNSAMDTEGKIQCLTLWNDVIHGVANVRDFEVAVAAHASDDIPDLHAVRGSAAIVAELERMSPAAREIIARHVGNTTLGMARWVKRGPIFNDEADLDDYMHEVAGRVGYLVTELGGLHWPGIQRSHGDRMREAREFGLGLQTVNVIRGLSGDVDRGWVFVPRSLLPDGVGPSDIFAPSHRDAALTVVSALTLKAERHLGYATDWVTALPRRAWRFRVAWILPMFYALRTIALVRQSPGSALEHPIKMHRAEVRSLARRSLLFGSSNTWVRNKAKALIA